MGIALAVTFFVSGSLSAELPAPRLQPVELDTDQGVRAVLGGVREGKVGTVLLFGSRGCAHSRHYVELLEELAADYTGEGIEFFFVNSDFAEALDGSSGIRGVTTLVDPMRTVADQLGISRSGDVVLLDSQSRVCFRGPPDDHFTGAAGEEYLVEGLELLLMEEELEPATVEGSGPPIPSVWEASGPSPFTYASDIAPLLNRECIECHRPGQIGPMSFLTYEDAASWAPMMAETVADGRMPPWSASPAHGDFMNERRLSPTEKMKLVRWALGGAPKGDLGQAPPAPDFPSEEWEMGEPDRVVHIPEQEVPAQGTIDYRYIQVDPGFEEDTWVEAVEIVPGNREVVHHIIAFLLPVGMSPTTFLSNPTAPLSDGLCAGYAPGTRAEIYAPGTAKLIPKLSRLLFELHYTANGVESTDASKLGFRFARGEVKRRVRTKGIINYRIDIPPQDPAATFHADHLFRNPVEILALSPHMHSRGKSFHFDRLTGSGPAERVLSVPRYDFNWQHTYELREPLLLDAGEGLRVTAVFDNSPDNPSNPDPSARVFWGEQTWEEMMIGFVTYLDAK